MFFFSVVLLQDAEKIIYQYLSLILFQSLITRYEFYVTS
jgi:hypothetical protein